MKVIATPEPNLFEDLRFHLADLKVRRLDQALDKMVRGFKPTGKVATEGACKP